MKYFKIISLIVISLILILSVIKISNNNLPEESDKIVHFVMYFFCAAAFCSLKFKYYMIWAICYGVSIEIIQSFIPWRSFSIGDILANSLGVLAFYLINKKFKIIPLKYS